MKALVIRGHGDLDRVELADVPKPTPSKPNDVLIALRAAALNHLDLWTLRGLPGLALEFPHTLGADGAGSVVEVGPAVTDLRVGERVMFNPGISCYQCEYCLAGEHSLCPSYRLLGEHVGGTLAEFIVLPRQNVVRIPDPPDGPVSWAAAAAFSLVTLTAWRMVVTQARVRPGELVLIWGIGGGVSGAALRIAKLAGAFVIATSSSDEKLAAAVGLGADVTVNHASADVLKVVRTLTAKRGVDVVIDSVGEATWETSLRALGRGGRLVTCGGTSGPKVVTDVRRLFWYQWSILGSTMGNAGEYAEIVRLLGQGHLRPIIDSTYPLERGVDALERLRSGGQMGKLVVEIA